MRGGIASRSDRHGGADQLPASRASLALLASLATLGLLAAPTRAADTDAATSTVTVFPNVLVAGSGTTATVTIQPKDASGNDVDIVGLSLGFVALGSDEGTLTTPAYQSGGTYTATYTADGSSVVGSVTITPTLGGTDFSNTTTMTLVSAVLTGAQNLDGTSGSVTDTSYYSTQGGLTISQEFTFDYLLVGGGGGGGGTAWNNGGASVAGGGGAGGQVTTSIGGSTVSLGSMLSVTVGAGGGGGGSGNASGEGGTSELSGSSISTIQALGGGRAGGRGNSPFSYGATNFGGAENTGGDGVRGTNANSGRSGGSGVSNDITGTAVFYGGGGSAGGRDGDAAGLAGGSGGGGSGTNYVGGGVGGNGGSGTANTGGGGGGASATTYTYFGGGSGGSGVAMLRFRGSGNDIDFTGGTIEAMSGAFEGYSLVRYTTPGTFSFDVDFDSRLVTTLTEPISGSGTFTYAGPGTLILTADSSYVGDTTISGGILQVGDGGTSGSLGTGDITNNGTLAFDRSDAYTVPGAISGSGTVIQQGSGSLDLDGGSHSAGSWSLVSGSIDNGTLAAGDFDFESGSVSAILAGSGAFTKTGFGTVVLSAANTYSGTTTIAEGTLVVNGDQSSATGTVSVADGATLAGEGTVGGAVSLASGATINAGDGVGTMATSDDVTFAGGSNLNWQITSATGTAGTDWDLLAIGGALVIDASASSDPIQINVWSVLGDGSNGEVANFNPTLSAYSWTIATAAGGISGFDASSFEVNTGATNGTGGLVSPYSVDGFTVSVVGNSLVLSYSPPVMQTLNGTVGGVVSANYTTNTSASSRPLALG
ncbi:MAG: autotransporter-associated beta strand repeat-containing protein, partial [Phycisphaerales bacterium]